MEIAPRRMRDATAAGRAAVVALLLLSGCYGKQMVRQPITVAEIAESMQALREQQLEQAKNLRALEDQIAKQADLFRQLKAESQSQKSDLEAQLLGIDSKLQDLLTRRGGSSTSSSYVPPPPMATPDTTSSHSIPVISSPAGQVSSGDNPEADAKRIYDQAYLDYTKSNYTLAVSGFREYLRRVPSGDLSDNAQFWIGDAYYAQRDYQTAIAELNKISENYPRGDRMPAALLKIAYSDIQLGNSAEAKQLLNRVIDEFPNSDEATLAKNKLRQLQ
ncbi:MAG: tol-pal system protein YbgF [Candidatus Eisenbacteria bacterium]